MEHKTQDCEYYSKCEGDINKDEYKMFLISNKTNKQVSIFHEIPIANNMRRENTDYNFVVTKPPQFMCEMKLSMSIRDTPIVHKISDGKFIKNTTSMTFGILPQTWSDSSSILGSVLGKFY